MAEASTAPAPALTRTTRRDVLRGLGGLSAMAGMAVPAAAHAQTPATRPAPGRPFKAVTTFTVLRDMAQNVAGTSAIVESITKPGAEIHTYEPTPRDLVRAQGANLILWNGLNLETWFARFLQNLNEAPNAVLTEGIAPIEISGGPYTGKPNPHAWMSPANALIYVENVRRSLAKHDPAHAGDYAANAAAYAARIRALDEPLRRRLSSIPEDQRWLVTSEGAFSYLTRDYGMKEAWLWPINAEEQGSPRQVRAVIDLVRRNRVPVVFSESTVSDKPARQVARETGAKYGGVLYVDSLSEPTGPVPTYLKLMEVTVETIARGFGV
ncbi:MAG: metal ABC transporter solute-binding protein, Zn/Mn family [Acetobacteraceae bacterium]